MIVVIIRPIPSTFIHYIFPGGIYSILLHKYLYFRHFIMIPLINNLFQYFYFLLFPQFLFTFSFVSRYFSLGMVGNLLVWVFADVAWLEAVFKDWLYKLRLLILIYTPGKLLLLSTFLPHYFLFWRHYSIFGASCATCLWKQSLCGLRANIFK